jgi:integrase/recombinase XerD
MTDTSQGRATDTGGLPRSFLFEQFEDYLVFERNLADNTVAAYLRDVAGMLVLLRRSGYDRPAIIGRDEVAGYLNELATAGLAASSLSRKLSSVRLYFRFLVAEGAVEDDPTDTLELPRRGRKLPEVLQLEEILAMLDAVDPDRKGGLRDRALIELMYSTGMRVSEVVGLRMEDIRQDQALVVVFGKGSKERVVPLGRLALRALEQYISVERPLLDKGRGGTSVFLNLRGGGPISRMGIWKLLQKYSAAAGTRDTFTFALPSVR